VCPVSCHDSLAVEGVTDLIKEWEDRLKAEGLSMNAGESRRLHYSIDPESFPTRQLKRDRTHRRRAKFIKTCACGCGVRFTGNAKRVAASPSCRKRIERARHDSLAGVYESTSAQPGDR
jgi:hypothetical protein